MAALRQWQLANNVNHDAHAPHSFFAIWAGRLPSDHPGQGNMVLALLHQDGDRVSLRIDYGSLQLQELRLPAGVTGGVSLAGEPVPARREEREGEVRIRFASPLLLTAGDALEIQRAG